MVETVGEIGKVDAKILEVEEKYDAKIKTTR